MNCRFLITFTLLILFILIIGACRNQDENLPTIPTPSTITDVLERETPTQIFVELEIEPTLTLAPTFTPNPTATPLPSATSDPQASSSMSGNESTIERIGSLVLIRTHPDRCRPPGHPIRARRARPCWSEPQAPMRYTDSRTAHRCVARAEPRERPCGAVRGCRPRVIRQDQDTVRG